MSIRREITEYDGVYSRKRRVPEAGDSAETEKIDIAPIDLLSLENKWKLMFPDYPFQYEFLDEMFSALYQKR